MKKYALWTIYVKYGLKSTEKFGNLSLESMEFWNGKCAGTLEYRIILTLIPLIIKINVIYCIDYDLSLAAFYGQ